MQVQAQPLTPNSLVSLKPLRVLFSKQESLEDLEQRLKVLKKKYPTWKTGWYNLSKTVAVVVVDIPLHSVDPWSDPLMKREEYLLKLVAAET